MNLSDAPDAGTSQEAPSFTPSSTPDAPPPSAAAPTSSDAPNPDGGLLSAVTEALGEQLSASEDDDGLPVELPADAAPSGAPGEAPSTSEQPDPNSVDPDEAEGDPSTDDISDPTPAELETYRPRIRRRIERLLLERNEARADAARIAPVIDFLRKNEIPQQDLDVILNLSAQLARGDYGGFLNAIQPYVDVAQQYTGQKLPPDLAEKVRQGYVSRDVAQELATRRLQVSDAQRRIEREQNGRNREAVAHRAEGIRHAVVSWEAQIRAQDADYGAKADLVRQGAQAIIQERGAPTSPEQARSYVQEAYTRANDFLRRLQPAPRPTPPQPSGVHQPAVQPTAEPKSLMDAAILALRQSAPR